jgi:predicted amidohydrolase
VAGALALSREAAGARPGADDLCSKRVVAVSFTPPFHDHRSAGVDLTALREMTAKVARERPDFVCYPEACTCIAKGFKTGIEVAPELGPYVRELGKIARECNTALVAPFLERDGGRCYNSVPVVDRQGRLVLVYRKNYPTISELEAGISPGGEVPVAECDGVRVGATVCFDANFAHIAADLERQRSRLVFWPSMYWGGQLLQHWALRYGFAIAVAYSLESAVIDMNGRYLAKQGTDTIKCVRAICRLGQRRHQRQPGIVPPGLQSGSIPGASRDARSRHRDRGLGAGRLLSAGLAPARSEDRSDLRRVRLGNPARLSRAERADA